MGLERVVSRRDFLKAGLKAAAFLVPPATLSLNPEVRKTLVGAFLNVIPAKKTEAGAPLDFDLSLAELPLVEGHFYNQGVLQQEKSPSPKGFAVINSRKAPVWTEFNKLGGETKFGYPISHSWIDGLGRVCQAFQNNILRVTVNDAGESVWVETVKGTPESQMKALTKSWLEKDFSKTTPKRPPGVWDDKIKAQEFVGILPMTKTLQTPDSEYAAIPDKALISHDLESIRRMEVAAETEIDMAKYVLQSYPGESSIFEQMTVDGPATTTITVLPAEDFCGTKVKPLLFTKSNRTAWWGRGGNLDLKWYVPEDFIEVDGKEYYLAVGDKRYDRDTGALVRQTGYGSLNVRNRDGSFTKIPAYTLFPRFLRTNDRINSQQAYYEQCPLQGDRWFANWTVWYEKSQVKTPFYTGDAIAVTYVEYIGDSIWAKETWHYAENKGVVQIDVYDERDVNSIVLQLKLKDRAVILDGNFGGGDIYGAQN